MVDILFVLTLFLMFAFSSLALLSLGANIYQKTANHMTDNFNSRTSFAYITQKIRAKDELGAISIGEFDGYEAIIIKEDINNTIYHTYLYEYEGMLYELMTRSDISLSAAAGTPIIELQGFSIEQLSPKLYQVCMQPREEESITLFLSTHTGNEVMN